MVSTMLPVVAKFWLFSVLSNFNACIKPVRQTQKRFTRVSSRFFVRGSGREEVFKKGIYLPQSAQPPGYQPAALHRYWLTLRSAALAHRSLTFSLPLCWAGRSASFTTNLGRQVLGKAPTEGSAYFSGDFPRKPSTVCLNRHKSCNLFIYFSSPLIYALR